MTEAALCVRGPCLDCLHIPLADPSQSASNSVILKYWVGIPTTNNSLLQSYCPLDLPQHLSPEVLVLCSLDRMFMFWLTVFLVLLLGWACPSAYVITGRNQHDTAAKADRNNFSAWLMQTKHAVVPTKFNKLCLASCVAHPLLSCVQCKSVIDMHFIYTTQLYYLCETSCTRARSHVHIDVAVAGLFSSKMIFRSPILFQSRSWNDYDL